MFFPKQTLSVEPESDDPNAGLDVYRRDDHGPRLPVDALSSELVWWMACRHTIKRLRNLCWENSIPVPKPTGVTDLRSAFEHIVNSEWYGRFPRAAAQAAEQSQVQAWLTEAEAGYSVDLASGNWLRTFAGNELLRVARGYIYQPPNRAPSSAYELDVAKSVAKWQVDNGRVPDELKELLAAIQNKI